MARLAWWEDAACIGMAPMFDLDRSDYESTDESCALDKGIPVGPGRTATRQMKMVERICRRICMECPVLQDCHEDAMKYRDVHTFRAGLSASQRIALFREMGYTYDTDYQTVRRDNE